MDEACIRAAVVTALAVCFDASAYRRSLSVCTSSKGFLHDLLVRWFSGWPSSVRGTTISPNHRRGFSPLFPVVTSIFAPAPTTSFVVSPIHQHIFPARTGLARGLVPPTGTLTSCPGLFPSSPEYPTSSQLSILVHAHHPYLIPLRRVYSRMLRLALRLSTL